MIQYASHEYSNHVDSRQVRALSIYDRTSGQARSGLDKAATHGGCAQSPRGETIDAPAWTIHRFRFTAGSLLASSVTCRLFLMSARDSISSKPATLETSPRTGAKRRRWLPRFPSLTFAVEDHQGRHREPRWLLVVTALFGIGVLLLLLFYVELHDVLHDVMASNDAAADLQAKR